MAKLAEAYVDITAHDSKFKSAMKNAESLTNRTVAKIQAKLTAMASNIGRAFADMARKLVLALAALGTAASVAAIKLAADWEQAEVAFTTMLGSAEKAKSFLEDMERFAARTPFELPGLVDASRKLLAFGFVAEDILPMMNAIGDAVSGLGGGAFEIERVTRALGQMKAKGKVSAQEMMQIAELGIPAWEMLADSIGTSIPEAMKRSERGLIDGVTGVNAILIGMQQRFDGMMEKQSKTLAGRWSTFKDSLSMVLRKIGLEINETFDITGTLQRVSEWLDKNQDAIVAWAKKLLETVGRGMKAIIEMFLQIPQVWQKIVTVWEATGRFFAHMLYDMRLKWKLFWAAFRQDFDKMTELNDLIKANTAAAKEYFAAVKTTVSAPLRKVGLPGLPPLPESSGAGGSTKFAGLTAVGPGIAGMVDATQDALTKMISDEIARRKGLWESVLDMTEDYTVKLVRLAEGETAARMKALDIEATKRRDLIYANVKDEERRAMLMKALDADIGAQKADIMDEEAKKAEEEARADAQRRRDKIGFVGSLSDVWRSAMTAGARLGVPVPPEIKAERYSKDQLDELKKIAEWSEKQYLLAQSSLNKLAVAESML